MEKNNENPASEKKGFTEKQKQELKKYAVYGLMFTVCAGIIWFIFKPHTSDAEKANESIGLNTELPAPEQVELTNKKKAYEQEYIEKQQREKVKTLNNFALLAFSGNDSIHKHTKTSEETAEEKRINLSLEQKYIQPSDPIQNSVDSYRKTNEAISNFYTSSEKSKEIQDLKNELKKLREQIEHKPSEVNRLEEQTALMEKSYQLAAKYFPSEAGQTVKVSPVKNQKSSLHSSSVYHQNRSAVHVRSIHDDVVSSLPQNVNDQAFIELLSQERNTEFHTMEKMETDVDIERNSILACIDRTQTVMDGQAVNLRLLVSIQVGDKIIPKNSVITGQGNIQGERLYIHIPTIQYDNAVFEVDWTVYGLDGQQGLSAQDLLEVNAVKDIAANMGGNLGTTISFTRNAGQQVASDLGKSVIQGTSQYIQKKIRTAKITLKAGHRILLVTNKN